MAEASRQNGGGSETNERHRDGFIGLGGNYANLEAWGSFLQGSCTPSLIIHIINKTV